MNEQAGTGPSRRHIQGSKIAKGHESFKVFSSTALTMFFLKSLTTPKKIERGDPLRFFYPVCRKTQKKLKGDPLGKFFFPKKSLAMPKKLKGGPFGLVRHCMLCGKLFLVLFPGPTGEI